MANQTAFDAFQRVQDAKLGSLADVSDTYLLELQRQLHVWIEQVGEKLQERIAEAAEQEWIDQANSFDDGREDFHSDL